MCGVGLSELTNAERSHLKTRILTTLMDIQKFEVFPFIQYVCLIILPRSFHNL